MPNDILQRTSRYTLNRTAMATRTDETREVMREYWEKFTDTTPTMKEMMLDHDAEKLHRDETREILSCLPDFADRRILELGAGIGRYTSIFAERAKHVTAIDFIADFIRVNKDVNGHLNNVDLHVADVTHFDRDSKSYDIIFSNWLLMYLNEKEVQELMKNTLSWLDEDGYFFTRESCFHPAGKIYGPDVPSHYRDPDWYSSLFRSITAHCDGQLYGFDIVIYRSLHSYIKNKNNDNQIIWLLQKVKRGPTSANGNQPFSQEVHERYSSNATVKYEKLFGKTWGLQTTKDFVEQLNLKAGNFVLDVGCGTGGSTLHMAKEYGAKLVGIDFVSDEMHVAIRRTRDLGVSFEQVTFETANIMKRQFPPGSFDVIYSKDAICCIKDKATLFKRFYTCLKTGGTLFIIDYCCSDGEQSGAFRQFVGQSGYNLLPSPTYSQVLKAAGFTQVKSDDKTDLLTNVLTEELSRIEKMKKEFVAEFSQEDFDEILNKWKSKIQRVHQGELKWASFYAKKI